MRKQYAILPLALLAQSLSAQFSSADIAPLPGTQFNQHYCQLIQPNGGGVGTTEDFSGLITDSVVTVTYVAASGTPNAASFPTADVAWQDGNGNYTYYNVTNDLFEDLGWDLNGAVAAASDAETWAVFPLGYGTTWTDAHAISFTSGGITTSRSGNVFGQGDATSTTLVMPYGTVTDVKRVFIYDSYTDNVSGFITIDYDFTYWFYYKAGQHHPVLIVQDLLITPSIGPSSHTLFSVYVDAPVGLEEVAGPAASLNVFPQPASDMVTVQVDLSGAGPLTFDITDVKGTLVRREDLGRMAGGILRRSLDISTLPAGLFFLSIGDGPDRWSTRLMVQH